MSLAGSVFAQALAERGLLLFRCAASSCADVPFGLLFAAQFGEFLAGGREDVVGWRDVGVGSARAASQCQVLVEFYGFGEGNTLC